ncbi:MAG: ATPase domain-containing protein [Syntrophales bacterium]
MATVKDLSKYDGQDQMVTSRELYVRLQKNEQDAFKVMSGIPGLDAAIDGFQGGELITISGPTKNGKTLFAQSLTVNFAKSLNFPMWFTFEVPARQFLGQFRPGQLPLMYMPTKLKAHAMDWLQDRIQEGFQKFHSRIVFLDHLHYLVDLARMRNPSLEIGQVIRRLKTLAVDGGFIIFLLCHTTKGRPENLSYEAIRDSSFVSQESDSVFMVQRTPLDGENSAEMRVEFHRRTGVMEKVIKLQRIGGYLVEVLDK